MRKLGKENRDLVNQLRVLNDNIDLLTKVTAISVGKDIIFKGTTELGDKVKALDEYDLPDKVIAMLVGSTSNSVRNARSRMKGVKTKPMEAESHPQETDTKDVQPAI